MNTQDIHMLVVRFLDGETTLEEERRLYAFFQREDVPEDLQEYQEMFRAYAAIVPKAAKKRVLRPLWWRVSSVAAACIMAVSLIGYTLYKYNASMPHEDVIVVKQEKPKPQEKGGVAKTESPELQENPVQSVQQPSVETDVLLAEQVKPLQERTVPSAPAPSDEAVHQACFPVNTVSECTAIYASNGTVDTTYQAPSRMDDFIMKFAAYHDVKRMPLDCSRMEDSVVIAAYVFPDKKEVDVFGRLLQAACWYESKTPGYLLNFSHQQFFFKLKDERKGLKYLWIAERINDMILLYSTHSPIEAEVSSECYQKCRDELTHTSINPKTTGI